MSYSKQTGMTLIEMVVVMCILGVLVSIAYPSYTRTVMKSNRTDAKADLMDFAQRLQRCYSANGTFQPAQGVCQVSDQLQGGVVTRGGLYTVTVSNLGLTTFLLTAVPVVPGRQADDSDCQSFTLDNTGQKKVYSGSGTDNTTVCW